MTDVNESNFGFLIAYVLPGFFAVLQLAQYSPTLQAWITTAPELAPTVGGFLFATLASVAFGLILSTLRWAILDTVHRHSGLPAPKLDFRKLQKNRDAFERMVQYHYRYYQFYGNSLVLLMLSCVAPQPLWGWLAREPALASTLAAGLAVLLFVASRDALGKYDSRSASLLSAK